MTVEPTPPQQANANPAFRRRRRKRKGASNNPQPNGQNPNAQNGAQPGPNGAPAGAQPAQPGQGMAMQSQAQGQGQGRPRNNGGQSGQSGQAGQKQGKKRFFKKQSNGSNGGNGSNQGRSANGGGNPGNNQRRNNKQSRQPRTFVGPMDHSYRVANGNYADAPPSTIELQRGNSNGNFNGNGNHSGYGQQYSGQNHNGSGGNGVPEDDFAGAPAAIVDVADVPTRIYCFIDDLFFMAKIQETSRKLGVKVVFLKNDKDTMTRLCEASEIERPALIVFDLNNVNAKPLTLIPKLKTKLKRTVSVIGFLSHLQGDLKVKATEAGCDVVMPRSAFSQNLPNLLRRYGADEVEYIEA